MGAQGIAQLLAGTVPLLEQGRVYLPADMCDQFGVNEDALFKGDFDVNAVQDTAFELAKVARAHLKEALSIHPKLSAKQKLMLLHAVHPGMVLSKLERLNFNVMDPQLSRGLMGVNPLAFQLKLLWAALRGKVTVDL